MKAETEKATAVEAQKTAETAKATAEQAKAAADQKVAELEAKLATATNSAEVENLKAQLKTAKDEKTALETAKTQAETDATNAKAAQATAEQAKTQAESEAANAKVAQAAAEQAKTQAETDATNAKAAQAAAEANAATAKTAQTKAEQALATKVAALAGQGNSYFASQSNSTYATKLANDTLVSSAQAQTTPFPELCSNNNGCKKGQQNVGKNIATKATESYAGYSAIRENAGTDATQPQNSFYYYNTSPTTNSAAVVDATYNGQVSYTRQNLNTIQTNGSLKLTLTNNVLSGKVTKTAGTGKVSDVITFNDAAVNVAANKITFAGATVFHSSSFGNKGDIAGTYHGEFAGSNAEHVVGTFESNSTEKDNSVQGAFSATK